MKNIRVFLLVWLLWGIFALYRLINTQEKNDTIGNQKPIIIIGAWISGLSAAKKLHDEWYPVLILEAKDYIGGRIQTKKIDNIWIGCFVDPWWSK